MRTILGLENIPAELSGCVLSIGNFDGVHLGHQAILRCGVRFAREVSGPLVVMTFDPHPIAILRPDRAPPILTPMSERAARLSDAGADAVVVVRVDREFLSLTADEFVRRVVVERFRPRWIVEGPSFTYGHDRQGNDETLRAAGREHGFGLCVVDPVDIETAPGRREAISSSMIRRAIVAGDVQLAARALGRPYALIGPVVRGRERGRTLGFPTANLAIHEQLLPADGVYAGTASVSGRTYPAAVSIGRAPTFEETDILVEGYLLDFDGDVYDKTMRLELEARLRPQRKFASADELRAQMEQDVAAVRERH